MEKDRDHLLLLVPADHFIEDPDAFQKDLKLSIQKYKKENFVVYGIQPTRAETGYGYIKINKHGSFENFIEKPNKIDAEIYYKSKNFLWNSGLLMFAPNDLISIFKKLDIQTYNYVLNAVKNGKDDLFFLD